MVRLQLQPEVLLPGKAGLAQEDKKYETQIRWRRTQYGAAAAYNRERAIKKVNEPQGDRSALVHIKYTSGPRSAYVANDVANTEEKVEKKYLLQNRSQENLLQKLGTLSCVDRVNPKCKCMPGELNAMV